jgi:oligoribonuclease
MLLPLDLETTGLIPAIDRILEVSWGVLNDDLSSRAGELDSAVIVPTQQAWDLLDANEFVRAMHTQSLLIADLKDAEEGRAPAFLLSDVEEMILGAIEHWQTSPEEQVNLLGSSVHFDRAFIDIWMPRLSKRLHHRVFDVSSLLMLFTPLGVEHGVVNSGQHRAENDIRWSIDVARAYASHIYKNEVL